MSRQDRERYMRNRVRDTGEPHIAGYRNKIPQAVMRDTRAHRALLRETYTDIRRLTTPDGRIRHI